VNTSLPSKYSWTWLVCGLGAVLAVALLIVSGLGGEFGTLVIADVGELLIVVASSIVLFWVALRPFANSPVAGRQWLLLAIGCASFAIGDVIWMYYELIARVEPPYPGLADVFYSLQYPLIAFALIRAGLAYRALVDVRGPAVLAGAISFVAAVALWFGLLQPSVLVAGISPLEMFVSAGYPLADVLLGIGPAVFVLLIVGKLGGGKLGWPLRAVVTGVLLFTLSDSAYAILNANNAYVSGSLVDYGWSAGWVLIAFGAMLAADLARPVGLPRSPQDQ